METLSDWITTHWPQLGLLVGVIIGLLVLGIAVLLLLHLAVRIGTRIAVAKLDRTKVMHESHRLRNGAGGDSDAVRQELRRTQKTLADATIINEQQRRLLAAQDENLASRSVQMDGMNEKLLASHNDLEAARGDLEQVRAQLDYANRERERLTQVCTMMERKCTTLETSIGMLNSTVTDLNAKRDVLAAEVKLLRELHGQRA